MSAKLKVAAQTKRKKSSQVKVSSNATMNGWSSSETPHGENKGGKWPIVKSGDLLSFVTSGSRGWAKFYSESGPLFLRVGNLDHDSISLDLSETQRVVPPAGAEGMRTKVQASDILISVTADVGMVGLVPSTLGEAYINQHVALARPLPTVYPPFLSWCLASPPSQQQFRQLQRGATKVGLGLDDIRAIDVPLPSLSEQRRLVAEIEKQFTRLDAGVAALNRVQANLKRYRAAVLKAACEGRLVPTDADLAIKNRWKYVSASEQIAQTPTPPRPNRWNSRSKDIIPGHTALAVGNPQTKVPKGWAWSALVEIAKMETGHTPSRNHPEWWDGDISWIGIADAREHDGRTIRETIQHTNFDGIANSASCLLPAGTVCISRTASVGYVVVMGREMATSQDFVNWIPTSAVTSDWLRIVFSADREALRRFGKGSVHKTIYFPEWLSVHIAVPPLAEQTRIVAEVERRLSVVEELEAVVSVNLQRATRLRQSILQNAFTGRLDC